MILQLLFFLLPSLGISQDKILIQCESATTPDRSGYFEEFEFFPKSVFTVEKSNERILVKLNGFEIKKVSLLDEDRTFQCTVLSKTDVDCTLPGAGFGREFRTWAKENKILGRYIRHQDLGPDLVTPLLCQ